MIEPLRISLYNGISLKDTEKLVSVMNSFEIELLKLQSLTAMQ